MLGYNVSVPPYVRQALLSRSINNDDILPAIRKPVLAIGDRHSLFVLARP
jgi:non-heme chloroperoxidase